ncbi:uncharacterized protein PHALS_13882 [Plasmopara halstedii]|uniref:Uncharacterized protein n=1 Tax=Plasmopara halstedii TaxID=4781 RepID=A0A0P1A4T3_PLAHL|nr:uncharacterized protein PHALS_13882 [Plasmopara halstedii]CEG35125.1 hypothetical protein PHALS_13882 [Plasmopara halstedii]|eukprot:XP_024571494.1 hypothetical protein PHALS_13882 [Plasmopara halstedii]
MYFEPKGAGDHLAHWVTLRSIAQIHRRGVWRFSRNCLISQTFSKQLKRKHKIPCDKYAYRPSQVDMAFVETRETQADPGSSQEITMSAGDSGACWARNSLDS